MCLTNKNLFCCQESFLLMFPNIGGGHMKFSKKEGIRTFFKKAFLTHFNIALQLEKDTCKWAMGSLILTCAATGRLQQPALHSAHRQQLEATSEKTPIAPIGLLKAVPAKLLVLFWADHAGTVGMGLWSSKCAGSWFHPPPVCPWVCPNLICLSPPSLTPCAGYTRPGLPGQGSIIH